MEKDKWYKISIDYDGTSDEKNIKKYYDKKIKGVDYRVCEVNGKIISKIPLKDITQ